MSKDATEVFTFLAGIIQLICDLLFGKNLQLVVCLDVTSQDVLGSLCHDGAGFISEIDTHPN